MSFTPQHLYFDDVEIGQTWESLGRTVTEADIVNFAGISSDFNPIHMDHHFAQMTPFRKPIAHGLLILSMASGMTTYCPLMRTLAFVEIREWHMRGPVFIGDTIHGRSSVLSKEPRGRGRRGTICWHREILNQDGKVVQEGVILTLVEARRATAGPIDDEVTQADAESSGP